MKYDPPGFRLQDAATLRSNALFGRLSDRSLELLVSSAQVRTVPRGTTLFVQDEEADRFFALLDGWVKLYRLTRDGTEAVADARVMTLTAEGFARCLREDDQIAFAMLGSLSMRLRHLVQQIEQPQVQPTAQRVGSFLLRFCPAGSGAASFALPFDKALIARRLGMQPETFSRALAKLRGVGVETQGGSVSVADLDALRRFCNADPGDGERKG